MSSIRLLSLAVLTLATGACTSVPRIETAIAGTVPAGRSFAAVAANARGGQPAMQQPALEECLGTLGMIRAAGAGQTLLHVASNVRPVRSRVVVGEDQAGKRNRSARLREELVLGLADATSGALLLRASAARVLPKRARPDDGQELAIALCAALKAPALPEG